MKEPDGENVDTNSVLDNGITEELKRNASNVLDKLKLTSVTSCVGLKTYLVGDVIPITLSRQTHKIDLKEQC